MIDHFRPLAPLYDLFAPRPDLQLLSELLQLPIKGKLLDAGGGTGRVSFHWKNLIDAIMVSDISWSMLKQARKKKFIYPVKAKLGELPFPAASFERVLAVDSFHHFRNQQSAADDMFRVLKPGGRLVIQEYDIRYTPIKIAAFIEKMILMGSQFCTSEELASMITANTSTVRVIRKRYMYWITADKNNR